MANPTYQVDILYRDLTYRATVRNLVPLDQDRHYLQFSHILSGIGIAKFRIALKDPLLTSEGDILSPFKYHVRIRRHGVVVWQGVIVRNPRRNHKFIEVEARTYLYLLDRVLIRHDTAVGSDPNYRALKSGTLGGAVSTLVSEAQTDMAPALSNLTLGTVDNPDYPADFVDAQNITLSGAWTFTDNFQVKFDYRSTLYCLQILASYGDFDFELTDDLVFNFKSYIGNKQPQLVFKFGEFGNVQDYDAPRDGDQMANFIQGIAADVNFTVLKAEQQDEASIQANGKISDVAAYSDVKNINLLKARLRQDLFQVKDGDPELHLTPKTDAFPLGQYKLGDTITVVIDDGIIAVNTPRRIVSIEVKVHITGYEEINLITNKPRDSQ